MNRELLTDNQCAWLREASPVIFDQKIAQGEPFADLKAAVESVELLSVTGGFAVDGTQIYLSRIDRQRLYGPQPPSDNLDPQG